MKKMMYLFLLSAVFATMFIGCATTETTTFTDPEFRGKQYSSVCVLAEVTDLKYKQKIEKDMAKLLSEKGISARTGTQLFPPTREWSEEQMQEVLMNERIEGYLLIAWKDRQVQETYKPGNTVTETKGEVKKQGGKDVYRERSVTSHTDGSVEKQYRSFFEAKLFDVRTKKTAWIATSHSESGEWFGSDFDLIIESYTEDLIKSLKKDGFIRK